MPFGNYVVYVDESGDHGLENIDPQHPVFVLAFCIFDKQVYTQQVVPSVQALKFQFWGHDNVILRSYDIRKAVGPFNILMNSDVRVAFINSINTVIDDAGFTLIAAVIDKQRLVRQYAFPAIPYNIALAFCMERLQRFLMEHDQHENTIHVLVERRGKPEDEALELAFRRVADGQNQVGPMHNMEVEFVDKKHNSSGLQFADLVAYPIGRYSIKPDQPNRAYEIVQTKFRRSAGGRIAGYGLKKFP
jgi:hypothetical protein